VLLWKQSLVYFNKRYENKRYENEINGEVKEKLHLAVTLQDTNGAYEYE
jgi:hypothetical protein